MSHDTCPKCRRNGRPCVEHELANTAGAILATVARDARPYNAPGGRGMEHAGESTLEPRHRPLGPIGKAGE